MFWRIFLGSVLGRWRRIVLASAAMVAGTAAVAALLNLSLGMRSRMQEEVRAYGASAAILPGGAGGSGGVGFGPLPTYARLTGEGEARLKVLLGEEEIPHAEFLYALGTLRRSKVVVVGSRWKAAFELNPGWIVESMDPAFDWKEGALPGSSGTAASIPGKGAAVPAPGAIPALLGHGLWESLKASGGKEYALSFAGGGRSRVKVVGRIQTGGDEDHQVFIPLGRLQEILGLPGAVSAIALRAEGGEEEIARLGRAVSDLLPGWTVQSISRVVQAEGALLRRLELVLGFVAIAVLFGSSLAVMATMLATVMEREKEVGLFRALGGGTAIIRAQLLLEGALAGTTGAAAGLILGCVGSWVIAMSAFGTGVGLSPWTIPVTFGVGILASGAAVILPLRRALRIDASACLRGSE